MKTGNYTGYCDSGYKRGKDKENSDRLINGLRLCGSTTIEEGIGTFQIPLPQDNNNYLVHNGIQLAYIGRLLIY